MPKNSYTHKESEGEMGTKPPNQEDLRPDMSSPVESLPEPRSALAAAALNEARIVIARSRHASRAPRSVQALWYAQMQSNLHAWWIGGGFSRDDTASAANENGMALDSDCAVD
jgi:hypothetical protein